MTTIVEPLLDIESASIMRSINYDVTINRAEHKLVRYTHLAALIWGAFPFIIINKDILQLEIHGDLHGRTMRILTICKFQSRSDLVFKDMIIGFY